MCDHHHYILSQASCNDFQQWNTPMHRFGSHTHCFHGLCGGNQWKIVVRSSKFTLHTLEGPALSEFMCPWSNQNVVKSLKTCFSHVFMCFCRSQWVSGVALNQFCKCVITSHFHAVTNTCVLARMWPQGLHIITHQVPAFSEPIARCVPWKHTALRA